MGNYQQIPNDKSSIKFKDELVLLRTYNHPHLRQIQIYKNTDQSTIFCKTIAMNSNKQILEQQHQERCQIQHKFILSYIGYSYCYLAIEGSLYEIRLFYEYQERNLKSLETRPPESLIWKIVFQMVEVQQYLEQIGKFHGDLNMFSIFLDQHQNIKILYNSAFPDLISQYTKKINYIKNGQNFLSFEALDSYRLRNKREAFDPYKQDAFSFGMTLLELISGQESRECYKHKHIQYHQILSRLTNAQTHYSPQLLNMIQRLLMVDERARPALHQLLHHPVPRPIWIVYK